MLKTAPPQVVGECARDNDLEVNPVREKKLTNIRTVNADEKVSTPCPSPGLLAPRSRLMQCMRGNGWAYGSVLGECGNVQGSIAVLTRVCALPLQTYLTPPRVLTLEDVIGYVAGDELIEVTPKSIRLRKQILESNLRKSGKKRAVG